MAYKNGYIIVQDQCDVQQGNYHACKLLLGEINLLSHTFGYCKASNSHFAKKHRVGARTIQRWLEILKRKSFIKVKLVQTRQTPNHFERRIYPGLK